MYHFRPYSDLIQPAMYEDSKTDISRSGRVRKRPKNLADFETQDNIDDDTVKVNQNSNKTAKNVSLECQFSPRKAKDININI